MDEVAAKREARRRRILENSEDRLIKITGRTNRTESGDKESSSHTFPSDVQQLHKNCELNVNGILADTHRGKTNNQNIFNSDNIWDDIINDTENIHNELNTATNSEKQCNSNEKISRDYVDEDVGISSEASTTVKRTPLPRAFSSRLYYIPLAVIVNVLLILRLDYLFGKTIAIPCFTMTLARLYAINDTQERQDGSLLFAAFILCNIKPEVASTLKRITTVFNTILGDVALYIFSFTLIYYGLSYCLYTTEIPIIPEL